MSEETFTCPRRVADGMDREVEGFRARFSMAGSNLDYWRGEAGLIGQPSGCSWCGSMSPDEFMEHVRTGVEIGPTDKSYKLYLHGLTSQDPDKLCVVASANHGGSGCHPWKDLTRAEKKAVREQVSYVDYKDWFYKFDTQPTYQGKFYTQHLSEEQGHEFLQLWQDNKVRWGYPGYPYTRLFLPGPSTSKAKS